MLHAMQDISRILLNTNYTEIVVISVFLLYHATCERCSYKDLSSILLKTTDTDIVVVWTFL